MLDIIGCMKEIKFQIAKVKTYKKSYKTKGGKEKESISNTISLGANSVFSDGDTVFVINKLDYEEFQQNREYQKENERLESELKEFATKYNDLLKDYETFSQEILGIKSENKSLQKKLEISQEKKETLQNNIILAQNEINKQKDVIGYQDVIIAKYEEMGLLNRLMKKNPKDNTPKPETLEISSKK